MRISLTIFSGISFATIFVFLQLPAAAQIFEPENNLAASVSNAAYKYEGNLVSRKYHQPNCPYSLVMTRSRKIKFGSRKQAVAEGYKACRFCLPASTRTVQAKIINLDISR